MKDLLNQFKENPTHNSLFLSILVAVLGQDIKSYSFFALGKMYLKGVQIRLKTFFECVVGPV